MTPEEPTEPPAEEPTEPAYRGARGAAAGVRHGGAHGKICVFAPAGGQTQTDCAAANCIFVAEEYV